MASMHRSLNEIGPTLPNLHPPPLLLQATDHARQLVEKYIGKPFFDLPYARGVRRMSERELDEGLDWIDDRFHLVR